ncbi:transcription factor EMB1444 isoform X2 [Ziziphus jujuba]|uniref:Transcription factor EMB1444 isoform X2 n=1 Tax=Ziziphus jujuba TaxID=326968 RepID=A0ABM3I3X0_ZIZJJ|nr:transcription factor EMB1444 isoform X2 [Ziziphus jujuba]
MGTTALRQFLKSLCSNSQWNYAVFWKLNHQNPLILTWEDGYFDHPKPSKIEGSVSDNIYFSGMKSISFSSCETITDDCGSGGYPIGLAVANMSSLQYAMGEGFVGEVAYTGTHSWVFSNSLFTRESYSELVPDDGWLLQFALGMKVAEDIAVVASVKDSFNSICNVMENAVPSMLQRNIVDYSLSSSTLVENIGEPLMENIDRPSGLIVSKLKVENSEDVDSIRVMENKYSTLKKWMPGSTVQDMQLESGKYVPGILKRNSQNEFDIPEESYLLRECISASQLEMLDSKMFELSCLEEELLAYTSSSTHNMEVLGESFNGVNSCSAGDIETQLFGDDNIYDGNYRSMGNCFSFPEDFELHKALGPAFQIKTSEQPWDSSFVVEDACNSSSLICNKDFFGIAEEWQFTKTNDEMSEPVGANLCSVADDSSSTLSESVLTYTSSSKQFSACQPQTHSSMSPWVKNFPETGILDGSAFLAKEKTSASFNGVMKTLIDKEMQVKNCSYLQPRKGQKSNGRTTRAKSGNNQRPRPRDRQLIQDRVKELRELVPNGSKCSIDGLLDQTIKHMLYLRSVTEQAEKLKPYMHQETNGWKNCESSQNEKDFQNGTSLAFEWGSETPICPIVVEDLEQPGHMLIEMQCDGHEHFFEITQVIGRLELTIIKGVMENRSNTTWAHFVVEVSKGFHRMDIFWPLLHLLQRRKNLISSKI